MKSPLSLVILVTSHPTDPSDCETIQALVGYLLAKCGKSNGDLGGCRGEGKFWAEEVEVVLVPNICWDKTKHRCAGTVSFLLLLFLKTSMSKCKCNDYLCMSTCFEICGSCTTPPQIHENPWVSWSRSFAHEAQPLQQFKKSVPSQGLARAGRWSSCYGCFFQGLAQGSSGNVEPDYEPTYIHKIYTWNLEPVWDPLFWWLFVLQNKVFSNQNNGHLGSRYDMKYG